MDSSLFSSRESPGFRLSGQLAQMFYYPVNFMVGQVPSFSLSQRLPHVTIISLCCFTLKVCSQQLLSFIKLQLCFRFYYSFLLCWGMIHWCWMGNCNTKNDLVSAVWKSHTGTSSASYQTEVPIVYPWNINLVKLGRLASLACYHRRADNWFMVGAYSSSENFKISTLLVKCKSASISWVEVYADEHTHTDRTLWVCFQVDLL